MSLLLAPHVVRKEEEEAESAIIMTGKRQQLQGSACIIALQAFPSSSVATRKLMMMSFPVFPPEPYISRAFARNSSDACACVCTSAGDRRQAAVDASSK